ncbi:metallophosphoesterase family protein [Parapedobacter sp. 10938]|uniref:metallophosphoesterase family protein n=1 Tax=Parapedobacter flavus TaxID=3110225 RepID=UPI002DB92266|nr:metallophosphoesterase family protein [Parapedobacter sp. 10938]MEC3881970.1 metallophosphoesterase family protein [Parapedobacter sp. 10938]
MMSRFFGLMAISVSMGMLACAPVQDTHRDSVAGVMGDVVTRLYDQLTPAELDTISTAFILDFISPQEKNMLATTYWKFDVDVPAVVSVMRDTAQQDIPFWLADQGFEKTGLTVRNELYTYEVWQKEVAAGEVGLGINGFDKHRPVYFVSVAPVNPNDNLEIRPIFPREQRIAELDTGAFTYLDWDGLVLTAVPHELRGQQLLPTIRGRAREAHVVGGFRHTDFPSGIAPDQITLTLPKDPSTGVVVQWRCDRTVTGSWIKYWQANTTDTAFVEAERLLLEDRQLQNDRYTSRFTAALDGLVPGVTYDYMVGHDDAVSDTLHFKTADVDNRFAFTWFGDVHNDPKWGTLLQRADARYPEAAFYILAGDLVNTGLHGDDWDAFFGYSNGVFGRTPLMAVPGNHDSQDGLGASRYQSVLAYPQNGPAGLPSGLTYAFRYENALFLMIDVVSFSVAEQKDWIDRQLAATDAVWKFVVFHFPPYTSEEPYPDIVADWVPLFDRYGVDMVMNGHFHYYLRTAPLKEGRTEQGNSDGTTYIMSVGTRGKNESGTIEPYAAKRLNEGYLYQHLQIDGRDLDYVCLDSTGNVRDTFRIHK